MSFNPSLRPSVYPVTKSPTSSPSRISSAPSEIPSDFPPSPIEKTVREIILTVALKGGTEFEDPDSYQSLALKFLENVLSPQSDTKYIQYYVIACIYTASFGVPNKHTNKVLANTTLDGWIHAEGWMTNSSYCGWIGISCENNNVQKIELFENRFLRNG
jgi:hypothetical protein